MHLLSSTKLAVALAIFGLCGCAATRDIAPAAYRLDIQDEPAMQRFKLALASQDSRALCLEGDAWPTDRWNGDPMSVTSGDQIFSRPGNSQMTRYCPGGCAQLQVPPGGQLEAVVPYQDFGEPKQIASLPDRKLQFNVYVSACHH